MTDGNKEHEGHADVGGCGRIINDVFDTAMRSGNGTWFLERSDLERNYGQDDWDRFLADLDALRGRYGAQQVDAVVSVVSDDWRDAPDAPAVFYGGFRELFGGLAVEKDVYEGEDDDELDDYDESEDAMSDVTDMADAVFDQATAGRTR